MKPLSAADKQRQKVQRAAIRERELRRFLVTLAVGALIFVLLSQLYPANDRGPAFVVLLALGLVLALFAGQLVDRLLERRRLERRATTKGPHR